jgi:hypothetical protein
MEAFLSFNFPCVSLEGGPEQLRSIIEKFQKGKSANSGTSTIASSFGLQSRPSSSSNVGSSAGAQQPSIMLCSLELKAAGLNLQCANHVIFVHPFFSSRADQASAWDAQAIGRVLRPGQLKNVNIWRFVTLETVEQDLAS